MKIRLLEILFNLAFWIAGSWIIITGFSVESRDISIVNGVETIRISHNEDLQRNLAITILISAAVFYFNLRNIKSIKSGRTREKVILHTILAFIFGPTLYVILRKTSLLNTSPGLPVELFSGIFIFYFTVSVCYGVIDIWLFSEKQKQKLLLEKKLAELSLLRSRLHPHFLFNVLNSLLAMVDQEKNPVLAGSIHRLSELLRYVVYETSENKVPVAREIDFIRNFAELQMLRFDKDDVNLEILVTGNYSQQQIEPGIFIPFVENAFKYGVEPEKHSRISIEFDLTQADLVQFTITNPVFDIMKSQEGSGTGINSVIERLKIVYPGFHNLKIHQNEHFTVQLEIATNESNNR